MNTLLARRAVTTGLLLGWFTLWTVAVGADWWLASSDGIPRSVCVVLAVLVAALGVACSYLAVGGLSAWCESAGDR